MKLFCLTHGNSSVGRVLGMRSLTYECQRVWVRVSKSSSNTFSQLVFSGYCYYFFLSLRNYYMFPYFLLFYFTRTMKIITGRLRLVLTEESPTTMDYNNKLAVFAEYYTRCLFPLSAFLNGVAGIHLSLINLNEIKTCVFEFFLACLEWDWLCYNIFFLFTRTSLPSQAFFQQQTNWPKRFLRDSTPPGNDRSPTRVEFRVFRVGNCFLKV